MHALICRFCPDTVDKAMDDLIDYATRKVEALIRKMPAGRYEFSDYIEDDVVTKIPIRLRVALTIADGEIHLDFTGSDIQVSSALNVPTAGKVHPFMSVALVNYFATRDRTIPLNAGVLRRVRMTLPEGSVVNPKFPAACGVRYATVLRIYDAVLGALARAVPEDIPAASGGQGRMVALSLPDPGRRRSRRSLHAAAVPRARRRHGRAHLARARARGVRRRARRGSGRRGCDDGAARGPPRRDIGPRRRGGRIRLRRRASRARAALAVGAARCVHRALDEPAGALSGVRAPHALRSSRHPRRREARDGRRPRPALAGAARLDRRVQVIPRLGLGRKL